VTAAEDWTADVICTFCVKPAADIETMVAGPGVYICNECVALCVELIETKPKDMPVLGTWQERLKDDELLATLPKVAAASAQVDAQLTLAVSSARARGITWTRIGSALGMTRQSAWERFSGEE
jgi:ClpX C4-type zinc finger protein